jgi:hypothetical protein
VQIRSEADANAADGEGERPLAIRVWRCAAGHCALLAFKCCDVMVFLVPQCPYRTIDSKRTGPGGIDVAVASVAAVAVEAGRCTA